MRQTTTELLNFTNYKLTRLDWRDGFVPIWNVCLKTPGKTLEKYRSHMSNFSEFKNFRHGIAATFENEYEQYFNQEVNKCGIDPNESSVERWSRYPICGNDTIIPEEKCLDISMITIFHKWEISTRYSYRDKVNNTFALNAFAKRSRSLNRITVNPTTIEQSSNKIFLTHTHNTKNFHRICFLEQTAAILKGLFGVNRFGFRRKWGWIEAETAPQNS